MSKKLLIKKSKIPAAGDGLFAKKIFHKNEVVSTYFGPVLPKEHIYKSYVKDPDKYLKKIHPYVRDINETHVVIGTKDKDLMKCGVLINDFAKLSSINKEDIQEYVNKSMKNANVKIMNATNHPIYVTIKRVKKGEEFYAHYSIGYWLMEMGMKPEQIDELNTKYNFESFYKNF